MTHPRLAKYLNLSYRRTVLGERVDPDSALEDDENYVAALRAELARVRKIGLGASLVGRDFAMYQRQKAIEAALETLVKRQKNAAG